jgi:hypothetical protein
VLSLDALPNDAPPECELLHAAANAAATLNRTPDHQTRDNSLSPEAVHPRC